MTIAIGTYIKILDRAGSSTGYAFQNFHSGETRTYNNENYVFAAFGFSGGTVDLQAGNISASLVFAANELDLAALLCISGSGFTVRSMARFRPNVPILGMTMDERTAQQLTLSWGVIPYTITGELGYETRIKNAMRVAIVEGHIKPGDLIGVLAGITGNSPATDVLRIMRVPS